MPEPDDFMTVGEVAPILKLNRQTVRNWTDQGKLPVLQVGRRVRSRRADFDALIEQSAISRSESEPALPSIWDGERPQPQMPGDL